MSLRKSPRDLELIRVAGRYLAEVLAEASEHAKPGLELLELDVLIAKAIAARNSTPSFLGFHGFPNSACLSLNEQVVHGIPDTRQLKAGDVLGIDVGLWYEGVCVDSAVTVGIGAIGAEAKRLLEVTTAALEAGIAQIKPGRRVGSVSYAIQQVAESENLGIVRSLTGHGVGHAVWEAPEVPNFGRPGDGALLHAGMVLAIEPMLTLGGGDVLTQIDGWGIITADGSLAAQMEHTVIVTERGTEIVTRL